MASVFQDTISINIIQSSGLNIGVPIDLGLNVILRTIIIIIFTIWIYTYVINCNNIYESRIMLPGHAVSKLGHPLSRVRVLNILNNMNLRLLLLLRSLSLVKVS